MKYNPRLFAPGILHHCYQRLVSRNLIFYTVSDYLVFFSVFCSTARKYDVRVLSLCIMPDHFHCSLTAGSRKDLSGFIGEYTGQFVSVHNPVCHHSGPLFESPFGRAVKLGAKKARTNLIYVGNNPVERQLCKRAEEYRWNFLAYARSKHPFSEPLILRHASRPLARAVREVRSDALRCRPLTYRQLQRLSIPLNHSELNQLIDCIIRAYNVIDYDAAIRFFDNYQDMLHAMHSTTGSEYDLNEIFNGRSDACYIQMTKILMKELRLKDIHDILAFPEQMRRDIGDRFLRRTGALPTQIASFLHLPH